MLTSYVLNHLTLDNLWFWLHYYAVLAFKHKELCGAETPMGNRHPPGCLPDAADTAAELRWHRTITLIYLSEHY